MHKDTFCLLSRGRQPRALAQGPLPGATRCPWQQGSSGVSTGVGGSSWGWNLAATPQPYQVLKGGPWRTHHEGWEKGPRLARVPSAFRASLPVIADLRLQPRGRWEPGSAGSGAALGAPSILFTGLGFAQGIEVTWRNLAKGYLWVKLMNSQSLKEAETPGVTHRTFCKLWPRRPGSG